VLLAQGTFCEGSIRQKERLRRGSVITGWLERGRARVARRDDLGRGRLRRWGRLDKSNGAELACVLRDGKGVETLYLHLADSAG
jgi:hypothetical protein